MFFFVFLFLFVCLSDSSRKPAVHGETRGDSRGPSCCCVANWRETRDPGPGPTAAGGGDAFA